MLRNKIDYSEFIFSAFPNNKEHLCNIIFQVTEDCNLRCSYCYQTNKTHNKMSFETAKKFIDYLFDNRYNPDFLYNENDVKGFIIDFIGGEPLLEIDLISQIIDYFEKRLLENPESEWIYTHCYNFSTNGTLYHTPKVQNFIKKYENLISLSITVDGNKELHDSCRLFPDGSGSYDLAISAALKEKEKGYTGTKITVSPNNVSYIYNGVTDMIKKGFKFININCCFEDVWDKMSALKLFNQLSLISDWIKENNLYDKIFIALLCPSIYTTPDEEQLDRNWCGVGEGNMIAIAPNGNYYPCIRFMETSLGNVKPIILGNVKHGLLYTEEEKQNREKLCNCTKLNLSNKECLECPISSGCSWCLGYSYQVYQNFEQKTNFICEPYKMSALATKYLCKINNDKENYDLIKLNYNMYKNLISEEFFNNINTWEGQ